MAGMMLHNIVKFYVAMETLTKLKKNFLKYFFKLNNYTL